VESISYHDHRCLIIYRAWWGIVGMGILPGIPTCTCLVEIFDWPIRKTCLHCGMLLAALALFWCAATYRAQSNDKTDCSSLHFDITNPTNLLSCFEPLVVETANVLLVLYLSKSDFLLL